MTDSERVEEIRQQFAPYDEVEGLWNDETVETLLRILDERTELLTKASFAVHRLAYYLASRDTFDFDNEYHFKDGRNLKELADHIRKALE
jgi:hypothetical protein